MDIGIDGTCWTNRRGYGRFLRQLLTAAVERESGHRFTLFVDSGVPENDTSVAALSRQGLEIVRVRTAQAIDQAASASSRRSLADLLRMSLAVARRRLQLFFFPSVYSYFPILRPVPTLLGVHDAMADRHPEFAFASTRERIFWRAKVWAALRQARMILTVSEYSRRAIQETLGVPGEKMRVVPEAPAPMFVSSESEPEPYVLYAGGISPNKNLVRLVHAFSLCAESFPQYKLVMVGDYSADGFKSSYAEVKAAVDKHGLSDRVVFTGFVPDEELRRLYQRAALFVFASLEEGFGLPPLEAMACGAPVIVSRSGALPEVVGAAGQVVDPFDEQSLADSMSAVLGDAQLARDLRNRSLRRAAEFSWDRAAERFLSVCEETARKRP